MSGTSNLIGDIEALLAAAKSYDLNVESVDRAGRLDLQARVEALHYALEDPKEAMFRQLTNYSQTAAISTFLQMKVFENVPRQGCISAKELASLVKMNEEVLVRLMRILTATGVFHAVSEDTYSHTKLSLAYLDGSEVDFFTLCVDEISPIAHRIPEYLATHEPSSILNPKQSPFSWANNSEGKNFYEALLDFPPRHQRFGRAMMTQESSLPVLGMFPFTSVAKEYRASEAGKQNTGEGDEVFIVDVAGGRGQSLMQIQKELKDAGIQEQELGKWILQDRKAVLDTIPAGDLVGVEKMEIDFFVSQPVKDAHIYYLRRIMHNWQDREAKLILSNISSSMSPRSRLLIGEMVVPEVPEGFTPGSIDKAPYWMDLCMLIIGGKERSEKEFRTLLKSAGLRLVNIWKREMSVQCVVECVKDV
ncbi:hypothetical protein B7494_g4366 [Chlorociboria aeruginascens]|nr:hypothetical protein B7494_g4366 [Chlorociboria aeruginascens]